MDAVHFEEFEVEASVTDRFQTTLPTAVRAVLGIGKREKIVYRVNAGGMVQIVRAYSKEAEDAALEPFLALLATRTASHPENIVSYTVEDSESDMDLVRGVKFD